MRTWHAVALAVVGWYLMWPVPYGSDGPDSFRAGSADIPLWRWSVTQSFDRADECEKTRAAMGKEYDKSISGPPSNDQKPGLFYSLSQCIATDDPRLRP